jgi:adenylate cyclase
MYTNYEDVDLTNRSIRMIPIALYAHAEGIEALNLSCNPMLDIPLDFVQLCTSLRELSLPTCRSRRSPRTSGIARCCTSWIFM